MFSLERRPAPHREAYRHRGAYRLAALVICFAAFTAACGSDSSPNSAPTTATDVPTTTATTAPASTGDDNNDPDSDTPSTTEADDGVQSGLDADGPDHGRVVVLAEEVLLADVLALGITPIASSATVDTVGFQGIEPSLVADTEVLPMTTLSLEYLATLEPDTIVTLQYWVDQLGADVLGQMGNVVVVPDGLSGAERITTMGELLERPEHAAAVTARLADAQADAHATIGDDCELSLIAVYAGPSVAAFVSGEWELPAAIIEAGCTLVPSADRVEADRNGRAWLSMEQLDLLSADRMVLMQSEAVDGEMASLAELEGESLWALLPSVQAGQTQIFDRLGYPGAEGQIRFYEEFSRWWAEG